MKRAGPDHVRAGKDRLGVGVVPGVVARGDDVDAGRQEPVDQRDRHAETVSGRWPADRAVLGVGDDEVDAVAAAQLGQALGEVGGAARTATAAGASGRGYTPDTAPAASVALVLGAGVWPDGSLSVAAMHRVEAAAALYRRGAVRALLISADRRPGYDEVGPMREAAL